MGKILLAGEHGKRSRVMDAVGVVMNENVFDYLELAGDSGGAACLICDPHGALTRRQFLEKVLAIGVWLYETCGTGKMVGVFAEHTTDTLLWYLGALASGNCYVPLPPGMPQERFEKICAQMNIQVVAGGVPLTAYTEGMDGSIRFVQTDIAANIRVSLEQEQKLSACRRQLSGDAPMYVIFTSGSTGEPKGIVKTHGALISFLDSYIHEFGFRECDRLASQTPFYFDASVKDIYLALKLKCQLHILDERLFVAPLRLAEYLKEQHISVIQWVPSALCMLSRFRVFDQVSLPELKKVLFVGEVMPPGQLEIWMEALPDAEFVNLYGSSELAGICMSYRVRTLPEHTDCLPIGYPLPGCEVFLVSDGHLVKEPGALGEIYVRSDTIASGYWNDPVCSAQVFVKKPCEALPEAHYYKSGDLAKYDKQGALVFVSRDDYQIKHMGHRIELGEIESTLMKLPQISGCCCLYEGQKIVLFYEGTSPRSDVSRYLKQKLPSYMLPNKIIPVETLPRNANGKADRTALQNNLLRRRQAHGRTVGNTE